MQYNRQLYRRACLHVLLNCVDVTCCSKRSHLQVEDNTIHCSLPATCWGVQHIAASSLGVQQDEPVTTFVLLGTILIFLISGSSDVFDSIPLSVFSLIKTATTKIDALIFQKNFWPQPFEQAHPERDSDHLKLGDPLSSHHGPV